LHIKSFDIEWQISDCQAAHLSNFAAVGRNKLLNYGVMIQKLRF
jgi:hypothetical protein